MFSGLISLIVFFLNSTIFFFFSKTLFKRLFTSSFLLATADSKVIILLEGFEFFNFIFNKLTLSLSIRRFDRNLDFKVS